MANFSFSNFLAGFGFGGQQATNNTPVNAETSAQLSTEESGEFITVKVRLNMETHIHVVSRSTTKGEVIRTALEKMGLTVDLNSLSILNEDSNDVQSYAAVADQPLSVEAKDEVSFSVERPSGTAG